MKPEYGKDRWLAVEPGCGVFFMDLATPARTRPPRRDPNGYLPCPSAGPATVPPSKRRPR